MLSSWIFLFHSWPNCARSIRAQLEQGEVVLPTRPPQLTTLSPFILILRCLPSFRYSTCIDSRNFFSLHFISQLRSHSSLCLSWHVLSVTEVARTSFRMKCHPRTLPTYVYTSGTISLTFHRLYIWLIRSSLNTMIFISAQTFHFVFFSILQLFTLLFLFYIVMILIYRFQRYICTSNTFC